MLSNRVGQHLGNYTLLQLLGRGGFAEVYLGQHRYLQTQAAIKVLHSQLAQQEMQDFLREAQTIARLSHPHIIRIQDFGIEAGTPYLVMPYAPRGTLRQRYPKGVAQTPENILPVIRQVASALQFAHEQRLIHRDIKPENMLLGERDEVLLSDFGIATVFLSSRMQSTQEVVGTIAYMAPEQIQGHPRPASDQYSLAVVMYEWLTGARPFQGSASEVIAMHLSAPVPPLREKVPTLSTALEQVMQTALAKDHRERFASVAAFAEAFEQACPGMASLYFAPTERRPPSSPLEPTIYPQAPAASQPISQGPVITATTPARPAATSLEAPTLRESQAVAPSSPAPRPAGPEAARGRGKRLLKAGMLALLVIVLIGAASTAALTGKLFPRPAPTSQTLTQRQPTPTPTGPAIASNSVVYLTSGTSLLAIRARDGSLLWRKQLDIAQGFTPLLYAGILYLGGPNISAYAPAMGACSGRPRPTARDMGTLGSIRGFWWRLPITAECAL